MKSSVPGIRPVEILEDEDHGSGGGEALEEGSPGAEELLGARARLDTEERQQRRLDPAPLRPRPETCSATHRGDLGSRRPLVVGLGQAGPTADHLAERPERDPFAIRRRAAVMPPGQADDAVEVLLELPGEATLADPADPGDADEPGPALAGRRVVQILEEPKLVVAADEWGLERVGPAAAAALGNDPQRPERRDRGDLALQRVLAGGLEGDRRRGRAVGRLADEDGAGRRDRLEPGGRVHDDRRRPSPGWRPRASPRPLRSARPLWR